MTAQRVYLAVMGSALVVSALDLSVVVNGVVFLVVGSATGLALLLGPRVHRSPDPTTWRLFALTCLVFAVGPAIRPGNAGATGLRVLLPDLFIVPGYLLMAAAFMRLLRRQRRDGDLFAVLDSVIIVLGAGLLSVAVFVAPALEVTDRPAALSAISGLYPVLDVVLLALLLQLRFTTDRTPAFRMLSGAVVALLVGDVAYSWLGREGVLVAPHVVDLVFLAAYALIGGAALHPSMVGIGRPHGRVVQSWSRGRLLLLGPALLTPSLLLLLTIEDPLLRVVQASGTAALLLALLARAGAAVREHADSRRVFEHLAAHDDLTGLPNRMQLGERLDGLVAAGADVAVLFIDLDGFKMVNDSWGHGVGDELLARVGARLREGLPHEVLVARAGGDEFVLVAQSDPLDPQSRRLAQHVITLLSEPYQLSVAEVVVTPSVGIACLDSCDEPGATALVRDADTAMYAAKARGRGQVVVFDASMRDAVQDRLAIDAALRRALGTDELAVHYQPLVDLVDRRVVGFEALLRWTGADGPVSPADFVPVAEENGLIVPLGRWVLEQALDHVALCRSQTPLDLTVSVNVSVKQLDDDDLVDLVVGELGRRGLPSSALRLEITESGLVTDSVRVRENLRALAEHGIALAVDDFGTGYSSLSYLSRLRVHEVKIDRSFVRGLGERREDEVIVQATVAMARSLGLLVVAEGIETPEQLDCLVAIGVERGQGFLLARPMPGAEAVRLVTRGWHGVPAR